ncbi:uncharacterized protein LOC144359216 [Saccoglossus kowalevskii]
MKKLELHSPEGRKSVLFHSKHSYVLQLLFITNYIGKSMADANSETPSPGLMNFLTRAGIPRDRANEYSITLRREHISYEQLSDVQDDCLINTIKMAYGDVLHIRQAIDIANAWKELFVRIGISANQSTLYGLKFSSEAVTRNSLHSMTEKHLVILGVNSIGDRQKILKAAKLYLLVVPCDGNIKVSNNQMILREYQDHLEDDDRKMLQYISTLIAAEGITVMSNAEIEMIGDVTHLIYTAGDGRNQFRVQLRNDVPCLTRKIYIDTKQSTKKKMINGIGCFVGAASGVLAGAVLNFVFFGRVGLWGHERKGPRQRGPRESD